MDERVGEGQSTEQLWRVTTHIEAAGGLCEGGVRQGMVKVRPKMQ